MGFTFQQQHKDGTIRYKEKINTIPCENNHILIYFTALYKSMYVVEHCMTE